MNDALSSTRGILIGPYQLAPQSNRRSVWNNAAQLSKNILSCQLTTSAGTGDDHGLLQGIAMEKEEARDFLTSLLNKNLRVMATDGRMFLGLFKCTDPASHLSSPFRIKSRMSLC